MKSRQSCSRRRPLYLEQLESRQLLAGNVVLGLVASSPGSSSGPLKFTGDAQSNIVEFKYDAANDTLLAIGKNATTINGQTQVNVINLIANSPLNFNGNVIANLGDGNDTISFTGTSTADGSEIDVNVTISGGNGIDTLSISNLRVAGNVRIDGDAGNDKLTLSNITVEGNVAINTGIGDDTLNITNSNVFRNTSLNRKGDVTINTGSGADTVTLARVAPAGSTIHGDLTVNLGTENDKLTISGSPTVTNAKIDAGAGLDNVTVNGLIVTGTSTVEGLLQVLGGDGNDTISVNNATVRNRLTTSNSMLRIDSGTGADTVTVNNCTADALFAILGTGNDTFKALGTNKFAKLAHVQGDADFDTLTGKASLQANTALLELLTLESIT